MNEKIRPGLLGNTCEHCDAPTEDPGLCDHCQAKHSAWIAMEERSEAKGLLALAVLDVLDAASLSTDPALVGPSNRLSRMLDADIRTAAEVEALAKALRGADACWGAGVVGAARRLHGLGVRVGTAGVA